MNINFEDIITKANECKERLGRLVKLLDDAQTFYDDLLVTANWLGGLANEYYNLDQEGREMLPPNVRSALASVASVRSYVDSVVIDGCVKHFADAGNGGRNV